MLQTLQHWDVSLFQLINGSLSNPIFDALLPWFREKWFWMPLYLFIVAFSGLNFKGRGWVIVVGMVLAASLSDFTSSTLVKKKVQRLRPCNDPEMVDKIQRRVPCGGGYSFTSSHAANHFAVAVFLILMFGNLAPWLKPAALTWAALIAFSQVYVGVHYPGDVFFGAILGSVLGWWTAITFKKWGHKWGLYPAGSLD